MRQMRAALHLLVVACLIWCALGISEPAEAHVDGSSTAISVDEANPSPVDAGDEAAPDHHHHCPVAPDIPVIDAQTPGAKYRDPVFPARAATLSSLSRAPPLQPPASA
jgi:hypothetical protein